MARRKAREGYGALSIVLLVVGILLLLAGVGFIASGYLVASASSQLGAPLTGFGSTEEATGAVLLFLGALALVAGFRVGRR